MYQQPVKMVNFNDLRDWLNRVTHIAKKKIVPNVTLGGVKWDSTNPLGELSLLIAEDFGFSAQLSAEMTMQELYRHIVANKRS